MEKGEKTWRTGEVTSCSFLPVDCRPPWEAHKSMISKLLACNDQREKKRRPKSRRWQDGDWKFFLSILSVTECVSGPNRIRTETVKGPFWWNDGLSPLPNFLKIGPSPSQSTIILLLGKHLIVARPFILGPDCGTTFFYVQIMAPRQHS